MSLELVFMAAIEKLRAQGVEFAVAGGLAASLYRDQARLTVDVDVGISAESAALETAIDLVESLGMEAGIVREADLAGGPLFAIRKGNTAPCIVVGRVPGDVSGHGVDVLLPSIPWIADAIKRARGNEVDFGFGPVPVLTLEDVLVSKLYALRTTPVRAKDLDDLQSILAVGHEIDRAYLSGQMRRFGVAVPRAAGDFLPKWLLDIARGNARAEKTGRSVRRS
jgi:hypothetical protein